MNPLDTIKGTLIAGLVIAILLVFVAGTTGTFNDLLFMRWLHIAAGIAWIGLLYYFNFVQVPALKAAADDKGGPGGAGISKYVAPRALLWFRWAAVATWVTGALYLIRTNELLGVLTFGLVGDARASITIGAWLGTIMIFNVWVLIWPNQQKILGLKPATDEEKNKARRVAFLASRTNTMLSIPMILFMAAATHGSLF